MKNLICIIILFLVFTSCKKNIDLQPQSNLNIQNFYSTTAELQTALTGAYNGMQAPLLEEWKMTELRSDNALMGSVSSTSSVNLELRDLDMFIPLTSHQGIYNYWLSSYYNIHNINLLMNSMNIDYNSATATLDFKPMTIPVTETARKSLSAEASFIRAYHYFNLVRLFGGVMLVHEPIFPGDADLINRNSTDSIYGLIIADLQNAITNGKTAKYASIVATDLGKVNVWCAKALLAKVYLTLNRKADAIILLQDIIANSGYSLQASYENLFSINNEMNSEIMFAVRYKAGNIGLGSPFPNLFAAELSGQSVVNGDGKGYNFPTTELWNSALAASPYALQTVKGSVTKDSTKVTLTVANANILPGMAVSGTQIAAGTTVAAISGTTVTLSVPAIATLANTATLTIGDTRYFASIGVYVNKYYPKKLLSVVAVANDAENDWCIIRYADVLLMLAEAQGNSVSSIALINQTKTRAKAVPIVAANITTAAQFEAELAKERRIEFAFENMRFFDLMRYGTTTTSINIVSAMQAHFTTMFPLWYSGMPAPTPTLASILQNVNANRMLLPIPQREIDNNTTLVIPQNPGY